MKHEQIIENSMYGECVAPLTIIPSGSENFYVVLKTTHTTDRRFGFYVSVGRRARVNVPLGKYKIMYATGGKWYGRTFIFGDETVYNSCDDVFNFYYDYKKGSYMGYTLTLYPVANGNMETREISEAEFKS